MQYSSSLFRQEAVDGQDKNKLGSPLRLPSPRHLVVVFLLVFVTASLVYLLVTHTYTSKVSVVGWLVTEQASIDVYPLENNSLLSEVAVRPNQRVSKGETLAYLVRSDVQLSGEASHNEHVTSKTKQLAQLNEQANLNKRQFQQSLLQNERLIVNLSTQESTSQRRLSQLEGLIALHGSQEKELNRLYQSGSLPKVTYQQSQEKGLQLEIQRSDAKLALQQVKQSIDVARHNHHKLRLQQAEKHSHLVGQIEQMKQTLLSADGADTYSILSPIDGFVKNLQVVSGERLHLSHFMMQISPVSNTLKARMYIPSKQAGFIAKEQAVGLKLSAFPYQKFGMASARVKEISDNILLPQQIKEVPFTLQSPVFIVEAELATQTLSANGKEINLKDGMLFEAEVELSEMKLWEWLLRPILSLRGTV